jgi:hypothetical protein
MASMLFTMKAIRSPALVCRKHLEVSMTHNVIGRQVNSPDVNLVSDECSITDY